MTIRRTRSVRSVVSQHASSIATVILGFALVTSALPLCAQIPTFDDCVEPDVEIGGDDDQVITAFEVEDELLVEDVRVHIEISHTWIGDLTVTLESPADTEVTLHDGLGTLDDDLHLTWTDAGVFNGTDDYDCDCDMRPSGPGRMVDFFEEEANGEWTVLCEDTDDTDVGTVDQVCLELDLIPPPPPFVRGDVNGDGDLEVVIDAVALLEWQFNRGDPPFCDDAADCDDDGDVVAILDALFLLGWAFLDGDAPPSPGTEECGDDPTADELACVEEPICD